MTTLCPRIFRRKNVPTPQKTTYLDVLAYKSSGQRKAAPGKSSAALIIIKIMFYLGFWGIIVRSARPVPLSLIQRNFHVYLRAPILRKSGKAIREIAFENAGKNPDRKFLCGTQGFYFGGSSHRIPRGENLLGYSIFQKAWVLLYFLRTKIVPTPPKPSYLERSA